jgi:hypothetical protein
MPHLLRFSFAAPSVLLGLGWLSLAGNASAHIELQSPLNRYSDIKAGDNKSCPCGSGTTNRGCTKPEELSDPDRSADRATTFAPGDTIKVRFDEYVGHSGRFRIAFDPDGADLDHFNQNILLDEPDPVGNEGNLGQGSLWEFQVTLPDMTCDHCTLQLIQEMDGNTTDPVLDPRLRLRAGTYFQCADIVLAEGTRPGGIPPVAPTPHPGTRSRAEIAAGTAPASSIPVSRADAGLDPGTSAPEDAAGCALTKGRASHAASGAAALAALLVASGWRRRATRR